MLHPMASSYLIGRVLGIPVKVHITLLLFLPLIALQIAESVGIQSILWGLLAAAGLFGSVALHELGHSVVALSKGIRVREILLLPIGGLAQLAYMPSRPRDELQIAIAGPVVSLLLAVFFGLLTITLGALMPYWFSTILIVLGWVNFMLAAFNLLPSFPMDGGRIFRAWLSPRLGRVAATRIAARTGRGMAILFGILAILPPFNLMLLAIAVFIYYAANAEYRMVMAQERFRQTGDNPFENLFGGTFRQQPPPTEQEEDEVVVSPPPYARRSYPDPADLWRTLRRKQRDLFDQLTRDWFKP
jgi:Zn-dependent protease